jgi:hypothetical protein
MNLSFYRFFFRRDGVTVSVEVFQCDGDTSAIVKAKELLGQSSFTLMEVWQGARKVGVVERGPTDQTRSSAI